jgi:MYXO-CTERM domain-containing protein
MRIVRPALVALGLLASCDQASSPDGGAEGPAGKADGVRQCPDGPVSFANPSDSATAAARQDALQTYADQLLVAKACELEADFGDARVDPLEDYRIRINPEGCLGDRLDSDGNFAQMDRQVESVVQFITDFHADMEGRTTHLFDTIDVCEKDHKGGDLYLDMESGVLTVGASYSFFGEGGIGMAPKDGADVRQWWTDGQHIEHLESVQAWNDAMFWDGTDDLWQMFDPVGEARIALRDQIRGEVSSVLTDLGYDADGNVGIDADGLAELGQISLIGPRPGGRNVRACVIGYAQQATDAQAEDFGVLWARAMARPASHNAVIESLLVASQPPGKIADRSIAEACGPVDFDEIELVGIDVRDFMGPYATSMLDYVVPSEGTEYAEGSTSCQYGIEDVDMVVSADKSVATAAADWALQQLAVDCEAVAIEEDPEPSDGGDTDGDDSAGDTDGDTKGEEPGGDTDGGTGGEDPTGDDPTGDDDSDPPDDDSDDSPNPFDPSDDEDDQDDGADLDPFEDVEEMDSQAGGCSVSGGAASEGALAILGLLLLGYRRRSS